ncbi:hypothetical protein INR49_000629 [Caranx melampygus]|nr:hypothetical protein INR49_000629 [Caranx melampygus]
MREGQSPNPVPSKIRLSRLALAWSMTAGRWGVGGQQGKQVELENRELPAASPVKRRAVRLLSSSSWPGCWLLAACAACAGGAAAGAEGFLDQLAQLGRVDRESRGVNWCANREENQEISWCANAQSLSCRDGALRLVPTKPFMVLSKAQLSKVPTADLLSDPEVWANHQNPRVGASAPATMPRSIPCLPRHPLPLLCLSLPSTSTATTSSSTSSPSASSTPNSSLVKVHQFVVAWPLHGYANSMHPKQPPKQLPSGSSPETVRCEPLPRCQGPSNTETQGESGDPGLEMVTYAERMHYVPELAKPISPQWVRDYKDPRYYRSPPAQDMPLYKEKTCYVFSQRTSMLEGVRQALWLTKTKLISGLPPQLASFAEDPANQIPDQDERVQNAIKHARFWDTTEKRPGKEKYCNTLLFNLMHLCATLQSTHPSIGRRILTEKYSLAATWKRGEDLFQIRGRNSFLHNSMDALPEVSGNRKLQKPQIMSWKPSIPSPRPSTYRKYSCTRRRRTVQVSGLTTHTPMPTHFTSRRQLRPATQPQSILDHPITVQAVGTNGRVFQFMVFQLNTTDLSGDNGVKNQLWLDKNVELYDFAKVRPLIKNKQVKVPAGLAGYKPEAFSKFLALYLHGAV